MPKYLLSYKWNSAAEIKHSQIKSALENSGWNSDITANNKTIKTKIGMLDSSPNTTLIGDFDSADKAELNIISTIKKLYIENHRIKYPFSSNDAAEIGVYNNLFDDEESDDLECYIIVQVGSDNLIKE